LIDETLISKENFQNLLIFLDFHHIKEHILLWRLKRTAKMTHLRRYGSLYIKPSHWFYVQQLAIT